MSDIVLTCPACRKTRTISEFSDQTAQTCRHCGAAIAPTTQQATAHAAENARPGLKVARRRTQSNAGTPSSAGAPAVTPLPAPVEADEGPAPASGKIAGPALRKERRLVSHAWIAMALFLVIGGAMWRLRYHNLLPPKYLAYSAEYAWIVVIGMHAAIVLRAMTESFFQGILCLLVPGYSLYYLFAVTDAFYTRAIVAGLLIGIGQDAALRINEHATRITSVVQTWIAHGGGEIR
jgi:hypothetical protein